MNTIYSVLSLSLSIKKINFQLRFSAIASKRNASNTHDQSSTSNCYLDQLNELNRTKKISKQSHGQKENQPRFQKKCFFLRFPSVYLELISEKKGERSKFNPQPMIKRMKLKLNIHQHQLKDIIAYLEG